MDLKLAIFFAAMLAAASGIAFYLRSNARQTRLRREYKDIETSDKYEAILEEIRRKPDEPTLPEEAILVGRSIMSVPSIQRDVNKAREAGRRIGASEVESFRPLAKSDDL